MGWEQGRKAEIISFEDEKLMWEKGILGDNNPHAVPVSYDVIYEWLVFCIT